MMNDISIHENRSVDPVTQFSRELGMNMNRLESILPEHLSVKRFCSISMIAVQNNPELLDADRQTLLNELLKCGGDGLIPDNREATLQIYNSKVRINGRDQWVKKVQYLPMVRGIIKKIRKDPSIAEIIVDTVYEKDHFEIFSGDRNEIVHQPCLFSDRGNFVAAYAVFKYKDGRRHQEVMRKEDIQKAREAAKSDAVWSRWFDEKAKSSVLHRAEKRLDLPHDVQVFLKEAMLAEISAPGERVSTAENVTHKNNITAALASFRGNSEASEVITDEQAAEIKGLLQETETDVLDFLSKVGGPKCVDEMHHRYFESARKGLLSKRDRMLSDADAESTVLAAG